MTFTSSHWRSAINSSVLMLIWAPRALKAVICIKKMKSLWSSHYWISYCRHTVCVNWHRPFCLTSLWTRLSGFWHSLNLERKKVCQHASREPEHARVSETFNCNDICLVCDISAQIPHNWCWWADWIWQKCSGSSGKQRLLNDNELVWGRSCLDAIISISVVLRWLNSNCSISGLAQQFPFSFKTINHPYWCLYSSQTGVRRRLLLSFTHWKTQHKWILFLNVIFFTSIQASFSSFSHWF